MCVCVCVFAQVLWQQHTEWIRERTTSLVVMGKKVTHRSAWQSWFGQVKMLKKS